MVRFTGLERRKYVRLSVRIPVHYQVLKESQAGKAPATEQLQGMTENISLSGLRLEAFCTNEQIEHFNSNESVVIKVEFKLPGMHKIEAEAKVNFISTEAKVVYLETRAEGENKKLVHIGLLYHSISEDDKQVISSYIKNKFIETYNPPA